MELKKKDARLVVLQVRVTGRERKLLEEEASSQNRTLSNYLYHIIKSRAARPGA